MFAHFSLPNVPDVARRTVGAALIVGVAVLVGCISFGKPLIGLGACIGLGLGALNMRMIGNSVARVTEREQENKRRPLALNTLARMGIITVVTIGLLFVSFNLGLGVLGGVALFQLLMLVNVGRSMMHAGPMPLLEDVIDSNVVEDGTIPDGTGPDDSKGDS